MKINNETQFLLYKRLYFEIKIIREEIQNMLDNIRVDNEQMNNKLKLIKKQLYIITNNLYSG